MTQPSENPSHEALHHHQGIWNLVSIAPMRSLWDFQGASPWLIVKRTVHAFTEDNLLSRAAELGYYFLFALFPTLVSASAILGLVARSASDIYLKLLHYLTLIVPASAYGIVLETFNQTTAHSTGGKITFGIVAAIWSASVGFSAIQDTLNLVYKVPETRPYWKARGSAMLVTVLLSLLITLILATLLLGTYTAHESREHIANLHLGWILAGLAQTAAFLIALGLLVLLFAVIYYFGPNVKNKRWRWLTPGSAIGLFGWLAASIGLRIYLHFFDNYSVTYGSLGAVIVLLTWFYITGLMLLLGAEINSEIEATALESRLRNNPGCDLPATQTHPAA
jgi:membrane protein